jgi:hypothetical protein
VPRPDLEQRLREQPGRIPSWSATCALRERRSVADFDLHQPAFCETHGRELRAALAGR